jgi:hypothetical protein
MLSLMRPGCVSGFSFPRAGGHEDSTAQCIRHQGRGVGHGVADVTVCTHGSWVGEGEGRREGGRDAHRIWRLCIPCRTADKLLYEFVFSLPGMGVSLINRPVREITYMSMSGMPLSNPPPSPPACWRTGPHVSLVALLVFGAQRGKACMRLLAMRSKLSSLLNIAL